MINNQESVMAQPCDDDEDDSLDDDLISDLVGRGYTDGHDVPRSPDSYVYDPDASGVERRQAQNSDFLSEDERESYFEAFDGAHDVVTQDEERNCRDVIQEFSARFAHALAISLDRQILEGTTQPPSGRVRVVRPEDLNGPLQGVAVEGIVCNDFAEIPPALWQRMDDAAFGTPAITRDWRDHPNCRCIAYESRVEGHQLTLNLHIESPIRLIEATIECTAASETVGPYETMTDEMREQLRQEMTERISSQREMLDEARISIDCRQERSPDNVAIAPSSISAEEIIEAFRSLRSSYPTTTGRPRRNW